MKKNVVIVFYFVLLLLPTATFAQECKSSGSTVVFVNGILTTREEAQNDTWLLTGRYLKNGGVNDVSIINGYNPTHLAGAGDLIKSVSQAYAGSNAYINDYDLKTILLQIYPEVQTQKILLLGYSQGTFYSNALYDYLVQNGVPQESIAVYNVATPASFVAGKGTYLTSANDELIRRVRELAAAVDVSGPLPSNIIIPYTTSVSTDMYKGHSFTDDYLSGATTKIVTDINAALTSLQAQEGDSTEGCFTPPSAGMAYSLQKLAFAAADPVAERARSSMVTTGRAFASIARGMFAGVGAAVDLGTTAQSGIDGVVAKVATVESPENIAQRNFNTVKNLYGSSLTQSDVEELLNTSPTVLAASEVPVVLPPTSPSPTLPFVGFGASGGSEPVQDTSAQSTPSSVVVASAPDVPVVDAPLNNIVTAIQALRVSGTAVAGNTISVVTGSTTATTTVDGAGSWSLSVTLIEGVNTLDISTTDLEGDTSATVTRTVTLDTVAPLASAPTLDECSYSLTVSACLLASTDGNLRWTAEPGDAYYTLLKNGVVDATTTDTTLLVTLSDMATTTFALVAHDAAGNSATSSELSVAVFTRPLVINEVAWSGTAANAEDEWIELRNRTGYTLDLSNVSIEGLDGTPVIPLSGSIQVYNALTGYGFYQIQRSLTATTIASEPHQPVQVTAFDLLNDAGETLVLRHTTGTGSVVLDRTPSSCAGWCAGSLPIEYVSVYAGSRSTPSSMERISVDGVGDDASNWQSNNGYLTGARDANNVSVYGTPGHDNGPHYPDAGWFCDPRITSISAGETYLPGSPTCTYLMGFLGSLARRVGAVYQGMPGSAVYVAGTNDTIAKQTTTTNNNFGGAVAGDQYFVAIWEDLPGTYSNFDAFFRTGSTTTGSLTPPHDNYRTIQWTYGS